ncbi:Hypothetical predicted protein [Octopus vulgaris]|uniref:Uncharacterized protein n=1 Tax=Octopus vulgaris TaxID=6645 RepID=A0AA36EZZ4_OCTVU|nr:Hypothetical predicted protein [Octopus vulgaris]
MEVELSVSVSTGTLAEATGTGIAIAFGKLVKSVQKESFNLSSDKEIYDATAQSYNAVLVASDMKYKLGYMPFTNQTKRENATVSVTVMSLMKVLHTGYLVLPSDCGPLNRYCQYSDRGQHKSDHEYGATCYNALLKSLLFGGKF